ncbi:MAG: acylphosphatase [Pirellula sp.]
MVRVTVFFSGRVQGVGFRFTAYEIAKSHLVGGTVENLEDGRVKIIVEGEPDEVDRFVASVQESMAGKIKKMERFSSEPSREFNGFSIRR